MDGDTDGIRWVSYAELAELRGISKRSAARMAFRHGWARQKGNDGSARVAVPMADLEPKAAATDGTMDGEASGTIDGAIPGAGNGISKAISVLEAAVTELRERAERDEAEIERERARADAAEAELRTAREKVAAADAKAETAESRVDDLAVQVGMLVEARARADLLQVEVDRARAEAKGLKTELADTRAGRRRWFRWRR